MNLGRSRSLLRIVLLFSAGLPNAAQVGKVPTLRVEVTLVTVGVRVTDGKGREVSNLREDDFALFEDGIAQKIALFSSEEQPISLGILLDRSDSMAEDNKLERAKTAAELLVDAGHRGTEYLYVPFDFLAQVHTEFSQDREAVKREIAVTSLGGGTRLYDAILTTLERCRRARYGRQALVVITDGADQHSNHSLDDLIRALQESQVQLYIIGYFSRREVEIFSPTQAKVLLADGELIDNPRLVFRRLALESGAESFFPTSGEELQSAIDRISKDLRTQYTLAYYPSNSVRNDRYRVIRVKLRPRGLKVRARRGYVLAAASAGR